MTRTDIVRARALALVLAIGTVAWLHAEADLTLPRAADSLKFAVIGDNGTGETPQYDVGRQMLASRSSFPFDFVLMLGDNMYGQSESARTSSTKFERPYAAAARGRRAASTPRRGITISRPTASYPSFNMAGERYYTLRQATGALLRPRYQSDGPRPARLDRRCARGARRSPGRSSTSIIRSIRMATGMAPTWRCGSCSSRCSCATA